MQDVVCRWDKDTFVLVFYDTNKVEAQIILSRIQALLDCTVYKSGGPDGGALSIAAQSIIMEAKTSANSGQNQLDVLIANLVNDPDEN